MKQQKRRLVCACGKYANYTSNPRSPSSFCASHAAWPPLRRTTCNSDLTDWTESPPLAAPQPDESCSSYVVRVERALLAPRQRVLKVQVINRSIDVRSLWNPAHIFILYSCSVNCAEGGVINCRLPRKAMA